MRASGIAAYTRPLPREGRGGRPRSRSGEGRAHPLPAARRLLLLVLAPACGRGCAHALRRAHRWRRPARRACTCCRRSGRRSRSTCSARAGARGRASSVEVRAHAPPGALVALDDGSSPPAAGRVSHAEPVWVAGSDTLQVRVRGALGRVRLALVAADRSPLRPAARAPRPRPISRRSSRAPGWGADESLRRGDAALRRRRRTWCSSTTPTRRTATRPTTSPRSSARSTPTTCARTAGRTLATTSSSTPTGASSRGAPAASTSPVIGAQTGGFNTGSVGIAVIGDGAPPRSRPPTRDALTKLIAWRLDVAHVDPLGHADHDLGRQRPLCGRQERRPSASSAATATRSRPIARAR